MKSILKSTRTVDPYISNRWDLYERLIDGIPSDLQVTRCITGIHWCAVCSKGVGLSMSPPDGFRNLSIAGSVKGARVKEIAELSKSWNSIEAAIGVAALNSYYNAPSILGKNWGDISHKRSTTSVFSEVGTLVTGKKVAVIGHFPDLGQLEPICELSILERNPQKGDLPDPACEFILPQQDFVFMTGVTLINKTMVRLLELSQNAHIVLVGPSVPLTPLFMEYGVSILAGTTVVDELKICEHIAEGGDRSIFSNGAMTLRLSLNDFNGRS